jgi:hypothetical protein
MSRKKAIISFLGFSSLIVLLVILTAPWPQSKPESCTLAQHIANKYRVNPDLAKDLVEWAEEHEHGVMILAIMAIESSFRPMVISSAGALGLGQIMDVHLDPL